MATIRIAMRRPAIALAVALATSFCQGDSVGGKRSLALGGTRTVQIQALRTSDHGRDAASTDQPGQASPGLTWFAQDRLTRAGVAAIRAITQASEHGLDPSWYDAARLDSLARTNRLDPAARTRMDSALAASMMAFLNDLRYGRLVDNPFRASDSSGTDTAAIASALADAIRGDSIERLIVAFQPAFAEYGALRDVLARYRALPADSGLGLDRSRLPIHVGDTTADGPMLRRRLAMLGDLEPGFVADSSVNDTTLSLAIARFQARHGLTADGVVGAETAAALAVPMAQRVRQIELALERLRWLPREAGPRLILVNIATFRLQAFDSLPMNVEPSFVTRVIVGRARRTPTPMLHRELRSLTFRPYWNVPRSILVNEILPELRENAGYLRANDMEAVQGEDQVVGDSATADLMAQLASGALRVRQRPGPGNALGRVRFDFPNDSNVYLHDTPGRELFARARRDLSHGCIRVEHPEALAFWTLRSLPGWESRDSVARAMAGPNSRRVALLNQIPIILEYRTAAAGPDGTTWFFPDIYRLDFVLSRTLAASGRRGGTTD